MKIRFRVDINKDIWNWQETITKNPAYGQSWTDRWPKDLKKSDAKNKGKLEKYLRGNYYHDDAVEKYADWMEAAIKPEVISDILKKVTGKNVPFEIVYAFITTNQRCPYDPEKGEFYTYYGAAPKWFYRIATHELMHFIVHHYYWDNFLKAGLTNQQANGIKEALTVLLNPIYTKKWNLPETGYPNHQNLRKDIEKISNDAKNFDEIIDKTIELFQKKYVMKVS